jgi:site-specific recombinase XerD
MKWKGKNYSKKRIGGEMATATPLNRKRGEAYLIRYVHPRTKKFVRKVVWCSKVDANKIVKKIESDIALGKFNIESMHSIQYTLSQLITKYRKFAKRNKSMKTITREEVAFTAFSTFAGRELYLSEITVNHIENYREYRILHGLKPATVSIEMRVLKMLFNKAVEWGMLEKNPVKGVKTPKVELIKVRFLKKEEINALMNCITEDRNKAFLRLVKAYLHTGARRIELLQPLFTWDNVDFGDLKVILVGLKGGNKRYIPMNETLHQILDELKREGHEYPFDFSPDYVSHKIKWYFNKSGIKGANLHSLRKTFGSLLLQNGSADLYTVSKLLGHSSVKTTEKHYVDLLDENYRSSVKGLDDVI